MFKNKKIVLFLLVLPLVAVLVAPKVALADDDSDCLFNYLCDDLHLASQKLIEDLRWSI